MSRRMLILNLRSHKMVDLGLRQGYRMLFVRLSMMMKPFPVPVFVECDIHWSDDVSMLMFFNELSHNSPARLW